MNDITLDRVARITETHSRRASLLALGAAALAGTGYAPVAEAARNKGKVRGRKVCKRQVAPCREGVIAQCAAAESPAACEALFLPCCDLLGQCNGNGAALCFVQLS